MNIYKVFFKDTVSGIRRTIKITAATGRQAIVKARSIRNGTEFRARLVPNDDDYLKV